MISVAVIDDEPITRMDIAGMLKDLGYSVAGEAGDGFDAVALCRAKHPDVVLMDVKMPVFDGLSASKVILDEDLAGSVVLLTAFSDEEIVELLTKRKIGPLTGFRSKKGAEFSAVLTINAQNKIEFVFDEKPEEIEIGAKVGQSPVDGTDVFETLTGYVSQSYIDKKPSGLSLPKILLGKEIPPEEIKNLLDGKKTALIKGFRSNKTRRLFDAYLMLEKGKLKFDFPPREFKPRRFGKKKEA